MVEACAAGTGNVGLTRDLFTTELRADPLKGIKSGFRFHCCPSEIRSFSADAERRKRPPTDEAPNISYRSFGAPRRGGKR
jgi:hypothetical protein